MLTVPLVGTTASSTATSVSFTGGDLLNLAATVPPVGFGAGNVRVLVNAY